MAEPLVEPTEAVARRGKVKKQRTPQGKVWRQFRSVEQGLTALEGHLRVVAPGNLGFLLGGLRGLRTALHSLKLDTESGLTGGTPPSDIAAQKVWAAEDDLLSDA